MRIEFVLPEPGCQPVTTTAMPPLLSFFCFVKGKNKFGKYKLSPNTITLIGSVR